MQTYQYIEEIDLQTIQGGGDLMAAGEALAAAGQADVRSGALAAGSGGLNTTGTVLIGLAELIAGGWMMIGGALADAFD